MKKKSEIRGKNVRDCPFNLPIPEACQNAGDSVTRMAPVEDSETIKKANILVYAYYKTCKDCIYADKIIEDYGKVDCNFGETSEGHKSTPFVGSALYPSTFHGIGLDGIYGFPLGYYADSNESRNLFFGLFSLLGSFSADEMIKLADKYDECGEKDKAEILDKLLNNLNNIKKEYKDIFCKIEKYLLEYKNEFNKERIDSGIMWDLIKKYYGPRQIEK